ncbi:MAG TPA: efflux RND transporter periplasmic adaptor subunit [Caulobacteraceae bacterium]
MRASGLWRIAAIVVAVLIVALMAWRLLGGHKAEPAAPPASALVTIAPVLQASVGDTVTAYGVIAGSAAASRTVAAPRAVIVQAVLVAPGQPVAAGAPLVIVGDTPATLLAWRQAGDAVAFAQRDLARVQRLYDQHLAANDQLGAAQKALADARAGVAAQSATGAGNSRQTIAAPFAGVVGTVPVTLGEHVAADAPLLSLIASGGMIAQLGVEPTRAQRLASGQAVRIVSAFDDTHAIESRLATVGRQVDPVTRLVTVAAPAQGAGLALGAAVKGVITVASHPGVLVPRTSVVYDEGGAHLFVVAAGKARQVAVSPGAEQGEMIEVAGPIWAGETVAVEGAYQLQDGMAVRTAAK